MKIYRLLAFVVIFVFSLNSVLADATEGEKIFKANCTACHAINDKIVGPALKDVHKRRNPEWLLKWIKNSQALIKSGDATAVALYKENNESVMTSFEQLSDAEIKSIIEYVQKESEQPAQTAATASVSGTGTGKSEASSNSGSFYNQTTFFALIVMTFILLVLLFIINKVKKVVDELHAQKFPATEGSSEETVVSWKQNKASFRYKLFVKHPVVGTLVVSLVFMLVFGLYGFDYGNKYIGVQKGYAPEQPIKYSHELHAGTYKINCLYCHNGADKGKQASIPSPSTCMNCHMHVQAKEKYNGSVSPEIQKIYNAVGWDAEKRAYDPSKEKTPIKWVRIHNLPDHAYFNHAQHVKIGKVECQACHGPIEKMPVVSQQRSLQMGWCINCHREAKVDVANNSYYEKLHAKLKLDGKSMVTVAQNGGLECGKCHY